MDDEKDFKFKLLLLVCLITIAIEIALLIWSNIQIANLDLNSSSIEAIQLAKKGIITFITLLFGTWITTCVSIIIPQIRVWNLYCRIDGHKYYWIASIFFVAYLVIPIVNTLNSIRGGFALINEAGISLFEMISCLL
jgi:hypothetical protein